MELGKGMKIISIRIQIYLILLVQDTTIIITITTNIPNLIMLILIRGPKMLMRGIKLNRVRKHLKGRIL